MKNQKTQGKGPSQKPHPSLTASGSNRRSRWETSESKGPSSSAGDSSRKPKDEGNSSDRRASNKASAAAAAPKYDGRFAAAAGAGLSPGPGGHPIPPPAGDSPFRLLPDPAGPPPPPPYGFQNLERRTIVLADGSVRSYFALPPDPPVDPAADRFLPFGSRGLPRPEAGVGLGLEKHHLGPQGPRFSPEEFREPPSYGRGGGPQHDYWASLGLDGSRVLPEGASSLKRKYGEEDDLAWHRKHVMHYGNPNANVVGFPPGSGDRADFLGRSGSPRRDHLDDVRLSKHAKLGGDAYDHFSHRRRGDADASSVVIDVNPDVLNRAFLRFSKTINENASLKKNFLENGKNGPLSCLACGRVSKEFGDMHALVMHTYYSQNADLRVDHLGLHKALCVLMGWNFKRLPETSKAYQSLSAEAATENREDLILWPPIVIIHYTSFGQRKKDGRMEGMGNKELDNKLKDLGFGGGRSRTMMNGKEGIPFGTAAVRFAGDRDGLREAEKLAELLERDGCGRRSWARISQGRRRPEEGKEGEAADGRILLYGYLGIAGDMDELDAETKKKAVLHSRRDSAGK